MHHEEFCPERAARLIGEQGGYIRHLSTENDPGGLTGLERVTDEIIIGRGVREFLAIAEPDWRPEFRTFVDTRLALLDNQ